jgi:diguanylate cyclase (GGDEF)-like protein
MTFNRMAENLKDLTESQERIRHQANHDPLTGLPNRLLLEDRVEQAILEARREGKMVGVMFMDLDGFKVVNDTFGHDNGDLLLKEVAFRLIQSVRQRDTVARLGGDEFVIILNKINEVGNIRLIAEKVLKSIADDFSISGHTMHVGISIGVSFFPKDGDAPGKLMQLADDAMYRAKSEGKNTYRLAS